MTLDHHSHPSELVEAGEVKGSRTTVTIDDLKRKIPNHCFKPSFLRSLSYLSRDLLVAAIIEWVAGTYIPLINNFVARCVVWLLYGYIQGLVFMGVWVLGHECGHGAFSTSRLANDIVGFILHSSLLTPYFSWKSTHRRHHIYANNLAKDHNYLPPMEHEYATYLGLDQENLKMLEELTEDTPIVTLYRIVLQQVIGWPSYITLNNTAARGSVYGVQSKDFLGNSHFLPSSTLFRREEALYVLLSDLGVIAMFVGLCILGRWYGFGSVAVLYLQPYLWVNHWIVAITYLHHTDPRLPKYRPEAWTFMKGALATIDRDFGWIGKHILHNIIDYHVIHHLFSRIPHYHAEEATKAIIPMLGDAYHVSHEGYMSALWHSFTQCQYIKADDAAEDKDRAYWYKAGPHPPPSTHMKYNGWL